MSFLRFLLAGAGILGTFAALALVVIASIALGPFFFVPWLLIYWLLRASHLTPKTFHKNKPGPFLRALFPKYPPLVPQRRPRVVQSSAPDSIFETYEGDSLDP